MVEKQFYAARATREEGPLARPRIRRTPEIARAQILKAAEQALAAADLGGVTVEAITRRAGMTRSAFYHYFAGLDELVLELLERCEEEIREVVDPWLDHPAAFDDYRGATVRYLSEMYTVLQTHRNTVRAVMHAASGSRLVYERWQSRAVDYFINRATQFIAEQVALGRSRVEDPAHVAKALILMNYGVWADNMQREEPDDAAAIGRVIGGIWNAVIYGPEETAR